MISGNCDEGKSHHRYHIQIKCNICGTDKEVERTFVCMRPAPRIRYVGCNECKTWISMIFRCSVGSFDHDYGKFPKGELYVKVDTIA